MSTKSEYLCFHFFILYHVEERWKVTPLNTPFPVQPFMCLSYTPLPWDSTSARQGQCRWLLRDKRWGEAASSWRWNHLPSTPAQCWWYFSPRWRRTRHRNQPRYTGHCWIKQDQKQALRHRLIKACTVTIAVWRKESQCCIWHIMVKYGCWCIKVRSEHALSQWQQCHMTAIFQHRQEEAGWRKCPPSC